MAESLTNQEIAKLFRAVAAACEVKAANPFRIAAYDKAAVAIEHATSEVKDLWDDGKLEEIPGVGKNIAKHLDELFRTGKVRHFERAFANLPLAMFVFLDIQGIGPKTAFKLASELKIKGERRAIARLKKAAKNGLIRKIEGFGQKSEEDIASAISMWEKGKNRQQRMTLSYADAIAGEIINFLKGSKSVLRADPLGSLRRRVATIGDIDISVSTNNSKSVIEHFVSYPKKTKIIKKGERGASILLANQRQVDLRVQKPESYGSMLQYFTGGKHHNIHLREVAKKMSLSLSEYGIKSKDGRIVPYRDEESFYRRLRMQFIPPELREDFGEIERALRQAQAFGSEDFDGELSRTAQARRGKLPGLPDLVKLKDIRGDLHVHSNFPIEESHDPGLDDIGEMVKEANKLGYEYLGFSEHNPSLSQHSGSQIISLLSSKREYIESLNYSRANKLLKKVFNGLEIDMKPDGSLAIPERALDLLDYGIASIHSRFDMNREEMTNRVLRSLEHPKIKIFGHPTGRKLGFREGYELDWDKIFDFCLKHKKWLEICAWPDRLDLPDSLVREAVKKGVKMVINTDAHETDHLKLMEFGVSVARRGWAEKKDIVNTLSYDKIFNQEGGEK